MSYLISAHAHGGHRAQLTHQDERKVLGNVSAIQEYPDCDSLQLTLTLRKKYHLLYFLNPIKFLPLVSLRFFPHTPKKICLALSFDVPAD